MEFHKSSRKKECENRSSHAIKSFKSFSSGPDQKSSVMDCSSASGSIFFRIDGRFDWDGAQLACNTVPKGNLASVRNFDDWKEMTLITNWMPSGSIFWLGLLRVDAKWVWVDDWSDITYNKWIAINFPQNGTNMDCGYWMGALQNGFANGVPCNTTFSAICRAPLQ